MVFTQIELFCVLHIHVNSLIMIHHHLPLSCSRAGTNQNKNQKKKKRKVFRFRTGSHWRQSRAEYVYVVFSFEENDAGFKELKEELEQQLVLNLFLLRCGGFIYIHVHGETGKSLAFGIVKTRKREGSQRSMQ